VFNKKQESTNVGVDIPILTIDHYPGKEFEVLGTITARILDPKIVKQADLNKILPELKKSAIQVDADAVIGTKISMLNASDIYAYGTAIRFK
jgi:hypothetical protein